MILKRITINRLPGILDRFELEVAEQGMQVIFGPNGIGKSSICRALKALYWPERGSARQTSVSGKFVIGGESWQAEREGNRVRWSRGGESSASPGFPAAHNANCFFLRLRDLVDPSQDSTEAVATEIRRQMSGGFDLQAISSALFPAASPRRASSQRKRFREAAQRVDEEERTQELLQRSADQLRERESRLREAEAAEKRLAHVERAAALAKRREELSGISRQLGILPDSLARMTGNELDEARKAAHRLDELKQRARTHEADLGSAARMKKDSRLDRPLDEADLGVWGDKADELQSLESQLSGAADDLEAVRQKLAAAGDAVGGDFVDNAAPTLPKQAELFEFLKSSAELAYAIAATRERLQLLGDIDAPEEGERRLERLRGGCAALRAWLRAPRPAAPALASSGKRHLLAWAGGLLVLGVALAYLFDQRLGYIAAVGAGLGLAALLPANAASAVHRAEAAKAAYGELGLEQPDHWDAASVGALLRSLETRASELEAANVRSRDRSVEMKPLQQRESELMQRLEKLHARRDRLKAALGLPGLSSDAELVDIARALDHLRAVSGEHQAASARVRSLSGRYASRLQELGEILNQHGETTPEEAAAIMAAVRHHRGQPAESISDTVHAADPAAFVKSRVKRLTRRSEALRKALAQENGARQRLAENAADQETSRAALAQVYDNAGVDDGDEPGLALLLEKLPEYRELSSKREARENHNELDRAALVEAGEADLVEMHPEALERHAAELEQLASDAGRLRDEIANTRARMEQARDSDTLQKLIAAREEERASLHEMRSQALLNAAGTFLLGQVEQEFEQTRMPHVFEKAREHFSGFTRHNYELRLDAGGAPPRLFAQDLTCRQRRELEELSDGTRAQLLLAARLAFAEEVEQGRALPLFLDEALDQSDPQRFAAVAASLGRVAREQGRQIIYLTSDPLDVERIRNALGGAAGEFAEPIDLGDVRTGQSSVGDAAALAVPPVVPVPAPAGLTPEEYGAALGVPPFLPGRGFAFQHFFYVVWDDPDLLYACLTRGVECAGQWSMVADAPLARKLASPAIDPGQIGSRIELLEVFCEACNQGRGKPVDRDALAESGAISGQYLEDVVEIAKELGGDPERILAALSARDDQRLKGFRSNKVEQLRNYLIEREYLDDRPVLDESELQLRCMASPAANALSRGVATECLRRWWEWTRAFSVAGPQSGQN